MAWATASSKPASTSGDKIIAGMFTIGLLGLGIDTVMSRLSSYLLKWHRGLEQG